MDQVLQLQDTGWLSEFKNKDQTKCCIQETSINIQHPKPERERMEKYILHKDKPKVSGRRYVYIR